MMRPTRTPHEGCGWSRVPCRRLKAAGGVRMALCAWLAALASLCAGEALAQDPSIVAPDVSQSSTFPKNSLVGPSRNVDKSQPLYLQGDELVYDTGGNRVIARGNVEIYYNNYILTADQVVYDQSANTLTAVGNVVLEGAQRQHRPRRPLHAVGRLPRRLRAVAQHHSLRQHPHRRRAARRGAAAIRPYSPTAASRPAKAPTACRPCGA